MNTETRVCQNCKKSFVIEPDDFQFYEKIKVPPPTFCPECRLIRRLAWRNERSLHKRTCALCGKATLAVYSDQTPFVVYCNDCWWSDRWDATEYGMDFDPTRPFLAQLFDLMKKVPAVSRFGLQTSLVNSEYTNQVGYLKNCYLITHSDYNEDCSYGSNVTNAKDCVDTYLIDKCESCYEITNCRECYQTMFSIDCNSCHNVLFSRNCVGCNDCFGCVNLRNKRYHIFNQPYSKEAYEKKINDLYPSTFQELDDARKAAEKLWSQHPQKYMHERHSSQVTGDYIYNAKNVRDSFIAAKLEDSRFCMLVTPGKTIAANCWDFTHFGADSELFYETLMAGYCSRVKFGWFVIMDSREVEYSIASLGNTNIFGCVGLKKKQYCILNKQYSKEEYKALREEIIKHMNDMPYVDKKGRIYKYGEFFPMEMSPFGYNETAHIYFPLTKEQAIDRGYVWRDPDERTYAITMKGDQLPDSHEFPDSVKDEVVECGDKGTCTHNYSIAFRFIPSELSFYKKHRLLLPRLCSNCRHAARVAKTNPPKLWKRSCVCEGTTSGEYKNVSSHFHGESNCPNELETSYAPDRPEIVYCEQCYNAEVA